MPNHHVDKATELFCSCVDPSSSVKAVNHESVKSLCVAVVDEQYLRFVMCCLLIATSTFKQQYACSVCCRRLQSTTCSVFAVDFNQQHAVGVAVDFNQQHAAFVAVDLNQQHAMFVAVDFTSINSMQGLLLST